MTDEERERTPSYMSCCPICKGMVGAIVDDGKHPNDVAKFVSDEIRHGLIVERVTVAAVRIATWCDCKKKTTAEQAALL